MQWLQKILFYMSGRYGFDELSKVLMAAGLVFGILANFIGGIWVSAAGIALLAYGALRILSRDKANRYRELQKYLSVKQTVQLRTRKLRNRWVQRKAYKIVKCPNCRQQIRLPRGRKKLRVTCPKCQETFIKKT